MAVKRKVPSLACSSSKAVQPSPPTVPKEEDVLYTAVPAAHVELIENRSTVSPTLSDEMKDVWHVYAVDFRQLTESLEMETGDSRPGNVDLVLTDPLYIVQSRAGKATLDITFSARRICGISSKFPRRLWLLGSMDTFLCLATVWWTL